MGEDTLFQMVSNEPFVSPDQLDASYELTQAIISEYKNILDLSSISYKDVDAIYSMVLSTEDVSFDDRKKLIGISALSASSQNRLFNLLDKVLDNAYRGEYVNTVQDDESENDPVIGLFRKQFVSFSDMSDAEALEIVELFTEISKAKDTKLYQIAERYLKNEFQSISIEEISMILHCLKPFAFPVIRMNNLTESTFSQFGVKLKKPESTKTYVANCEKICDFRDANFGAVNFYVFYKAVNHDEDHVIRHAPFPPDFPKDYWPSQEEYPISLTKEDWKRYITEIEMPSHLAVMMMLKGMLELGGTTSCKRLSDTYGGKPSRYIGCTINLGKRAKKYFNLQPCMDGDKERYYPIPFQGKNGDILGVNEFIYKMRDELKAALQEIDLSGIDPHVPVIPRAENARYWLYAPGNNALLWDDCVNRGVMTIGWGELGDLSEYESRDSIIAKMKEIHGDESSYWMDSFAMWQFSHVIKPGDVIIAKKGRSRIVGRGIVESGYYYNPEDDEYPNTIGVNWTDIGDWKYPGTAPIKTLTDITSAPNINEINRVFRKKSDELEDYDDSKFLNDVYISEAKLQELKDLLLRKRNIILQGAPGVGKTFSAKRLAYAIMGKKDEDKIKFVQFHQNYSYEDFIMGYKPAENGSFVLQEGVFYEFCQIAKDDPSNDYFFIIDEINRGNLSKIFGELLMAIEADYRDTEVRLAYRDEMFAVPRNLMIIGMMNTADRSLALIDYALRRRFSFVTMEPGFDSDGFRTYQASLENPMFDVLIDTVKELNKVIRTDESLGEGFCIGHSYFCGIAKEDCTVQRLQEIVKYDLIPILEEYWFDDKESLKNWKQRLWEAVK